MISQEKFEEIIVNVVKRDISSNEDQKNAIMSDVDESLFLVAGPGSGKTTVMVLKILKYIFVDDVNPDEIFATTFTKKAAEELYSRILGWGDQIKNYLSDNTDDFDEISKIIHIDFNQINVGTTDKLAEEIMKQNKKPGQNHPIVIENFVSNSAMIKILNENERFKDKYLQEYIKELTGKQKLDEASKMSKTILEIKDRIYHDKVDIDELYTACENKGLQAAIDCIKEYEKILAERNTMDFTMLEHRFLTLLKQNKLDIFLDDVKIVLIDEYQDTNLIQEDIYFTIAKSALKNNGSITVVGDDDQSLYRFRGATVDLFTNYKERAKEKLGIDVREINLKTNYRSTKNIINLCNRFVEIDNEYQHARVKNKPKIIAPDFEKGKIPILGMFRNNVEMLSRDLSNLISKLIYEEEVKLKVLKVLDEEYFSKCNDIDIAHLQQMNEEREALGKDIEKITLKLDPEYGSASDIAILSYSPKENQFGSRSFLYYLRKNLQKQRNPVEVFNPRGIELQKVELVEIFCGLMLECIDPENKVQNTDKSIPNLAKITMNKWRVRAREYIKLNPEPREPIDLSQFVLYWQNRITPDGEDWPDNVSLMRLAYTLVTWIEKLQNDVEGIVYLEAITKSITQTGFFSKYYSNISFKDKNSEKESILEAIWNIFIPISTGGIQIDETSLETLPDDRVNVLSIHQSKGLEFPLVIVDVGSKFRDNSSKTLNQRFPKLNPKNITIEDTIRQYSELGLSKRDEKDRSFDDLTRRYFVAFSRAESVLLLVGLNSAIQGFSQKKEHVNIPNVALGWSRDEKYLGFEEIYLI